jgi:hypothetical protein
MRRSIFIILCYTTYSSAFCQTDELKFITEDLPRFWKAFDEFKKDTTKNPFEIYFSSATQGLDQFFGYEEFPAKRMKRIVQENISYYQTIRNSEQLIEKNREAVNRYYDRFKVLYPQADKPDIYFVIGLTNRGGTTTKSGVVVAMEKFSEKPVSTATAINALPAEKFSMVVMMGIIFHQQKPAHTGWTLLRQCILQGSADFLTSLVIDDKLMIIEQESFRYGEANEETLVKEFLGRKDDSDFSGWLYQGKTINGRPADLGNWIGYKIVESYYHSIPDKAKAIDDILKINNFDNFLLLSGYAEPFRKP